MKKLVTLALILTLCLTVLTSCTAIGLLTLGYAMTREPDMVAQDEFFDEEYLAECKLTDMPVPDVENSMRSESELYLNLTSEEFDAYSKEVFEYLMAKDDAYFKGHLTEIGNPGGIFFLVEDRYAPLDEDYDLDSDSHDFIFSTTELLNEDDEFNYNYWNEVVIRITFTSGTLEDGDFSYNAVIQIKNKDNNIRGSVYADY